MDRFEFIFTLFGLLLGFSLVEVIAGFGRAFETGVRSAQGGAGGAVPARRRTRIGWLSPLLGLFVLFNLVSFWTGAWAVRDAIPMQYPALLFGLAVTGGYYFAASLVFPREVREWSDLDEHYFQVKRWVVAVVAACNLLGLAGVALIGLDPFAVTGALVPNLVFYGLLAALFFFRGRLMNLVLLVLVVALYPVTTAILYLM